MARCVCPPCGHWSNWIQFPFLLLSHFDYLWHPTDTVTVCRSFTPIRPTVLCNAFFFQLTELTRSPKVFERTWAKSYECEICELLFRFFISFCFPFITHCYHLSSVERHLCVVPAKRRPMTQTDSNNSLHFSSTVQHISRMKNWCLWDTRAVPRLTHADSNWIDCVCVFVRTR